MRIRCLTIRNFKSVRELTMTDIEQALILVGRNSTGKTAVLDAVRLAASGSAPRAEDFWPEGFNIEIHMCLEIGEEDLKRLNARGAVSKYKRYDLWLQEFQSRLPSYKDGQLSFTYIAGKNGRIRYDDGVRKNNLYIPQVMPKIHAIGHRRDVEDIQQDIFTAQGGEQLKELRENQCIFDRSRLCDNCFECIGLIEQKSPAQLTLAETQKLLEYKLFHLNMDSFLEKMNRFLGANSGRPDTVKLYRDADFGKYLKIDTQLYNPDRKKTYRLDQLSEGMRSIYILSLLEAYADDPSAVPFILLIEDPEIFLHPQLQKTAGEVLYRLSKKNQVLFSTHSPMMIFNFHSRQIRQIRLDEEGCTVVDPDADIDSILDNLGYSANDLMNVSFVFIVEGKQDSSRLPLLLEKYYSEIYAQDGTLQRIAVIPTNSCTNIRTYANLKYINKLYLKDQFLMIRDSDGKDREMLARQLCGYYKDREKYDRGNLPRVSRRNVLILKYYSFENYFLDPAVMARIGVVASEEAFYEILYAKYREYLRKLTSWKHMVSVTGLRFKSPEDIRAHMEEIRVYVRGHNLYDIFYGRYKGKKETEILARYIDEAPRETFQDILDAVDAFVYFENRRKTKRQDG